MDSKICVDASLALKLVLPERDSDEATVEWQNWAKTGVVVAAPYLFVYETSSVLRNRVYRKELTSKEADDALGILVGLGITYLHPPAIVRSAWELARQFDRPAAYDCFYLALAQEEGCPLWTGDRRLYNAVKGSLGWVHLLGS